MAQTLKKRKKWATLVRKVGGGGELKKKRKRVGVGVGGGGGRTT